MKIFKKKVFQYSSHRIRSTGTLHSKKETMVLGVNTYIVSWNSLHTRKVLVKSSLRGRYYYSIKYDYIKSMLAFL